MSSVFYLNNILIVDIVFKSILILILKIKYLYSQCLVLWKTALACGKLFLQKISEKIFMQDSAPKKFPVIPVHLGILGILYTMKGDFSIFADERTIHYEWRFLKILRILTEN